MIILDFEGFWKRKRTRSYQSFKISANMPYICSKKFETKIFQKTIISPVFFPASRYFVAILNIALRHWIHIIRKWAWFIEMYCSIVFSAVDDFDFKNNFNSQLQLSLELRNCFPYVCGVFWGVFLRNFGDIGFSPFETFRFGFLCFWHF